ncbi:MAG TPA: PPK2 family polyphosphate kinase [Micromonosporaceae bacterium]
MDLRDVLRLPPGAPVDLSAIDAGSTPGLPDDRKVREHPKRWARADLAAVAEDLASLQERLYATAKVGAGDRRLLMVLQAMDCGGKDGTIKKVAGVMNPEGLRVVAFGTPTPEELSHDFLWRIRRALPEKGYIGVFNRSHYEDVLIARVHNLVPERVWQHRYARINEFERELVDSGCVLLKIMLHISYQEQRRRLLARLDDPTKHWKYNPADIDERAYWSDYQTAYADALSRCGTDVAPWFVVPADHKWYRNWAVSHLLRATLADLGLRYPPAEFDVEVERARLLGDARPGAPAGSRRAEDEQAEHEHQVNVR